MSSQFSYEEVRITDPETGGQKGQKGERFDLIPVFALEELARVYGWGAGKYEDRNWERGYSWGLSFASLLRHVWAFWRGESLDPESGLHHLAHAMWHCCTLMLFERHYPEKDDRSALQGKSDPFSAFDTQRRYLEEHARHRASDAKAHASRERWIPGPTGDNVRDLDFGDSM